MPDPVEHSYSERERELRDLLRTRSEEKAREFAGEKVERQVRAPRSNAAVVSQQDSQQIAQPQTSVPVVQNPDMNRMVESVSNAAKQLQDLSPSALTDDQKKAGVGLTGAALLAYLASRFIGGGDNTPPDDNNPPNNSTKSREIRRDPMMDVSRTGPLEPTFNPEQPLDLTKPLPISAEQAAAHIAEMPEHPNPITKIEPSTLSQVGASNLAGETKEAISQQKKIKGKSGGAVEPKALTEGIAKATAVEPFTRDAVGNIQWKQGMSPAARAGAEAFATQFPEVAKELEAKGKFGILGAGSGDNNLYNSYGSDMMKTLRNEVNQGQMVGTYGNYEKNVNPAIKAISPETALGKQLEDLRINQPKGGVHGQLGQPVAMREGKLLIDKNKLNKTLSAGGAAALVMAIADQANAAQQRPQTVAPVLPPETGGGAYIGYPNLQRQGQAIQRAGEARIPENIQDPATYAAVRGFLTGNPESDISVLSEKRKKAQEAAYYGSQFSNLLQMLGR